MAAATFNAIDQVGRNRAQMTRRVEIEKVLNFGTVNGTTGVAAGESVAFMKTPKGFIFEDCYPVLKKAEGGAGNFDLGTEADPDCLLDGGDANGTEGAAIAKAGTEACKAGTPMSETEIRASIAAAQPTLNAATVLVVLIGYISDEI